MDKKAADSFSVGCYNVLCSTYAVKWKEQQGVGQDGESNWNERWPAMREIISKAGFDVLCLQEVEHADVATIVSDLGENYKTCYFKHTKRPPDGVLIAFRSDAFQTGELWKESGDGATAFGRVDLVHSKTGNRVRVLTGHMRGRKQEQLDSFYAFAAEGNSADVTVITADFNEDFSAEGEIRCPFPVGYLTMEREHGLPKLSRPPNKQKEDQTSGKGKIDWIWVKGNTDSVELFRDEASTVAILESHAPCKATGDWPSDHGCEALSVRMPAKRLRS
eukprot:TRINITY_DN86896_c0_g1_i1.p1 TRINITY_DN86896_c0_g1~~TRINITY_DN86896_c0_g1_i1.p1  ORF type:complete len:276 (-),score=47.24 TRINITY_DN86896_c0_g1_i1:49-876(-)